MAGQNGPGVISDNRYDAVEGLYALRNDLNLLVAVLSRIAIRPHRVDRQISDCETRALLVTMLILRSAS